MSHFSKILTHRIKRLTICLVLLLSWLFKPTYKIEFNFVQQSIKSKTRQAANIQAHYIEKILT